MLVNSSNYSSRQTAPVKLLTLVADSLWLELAREWLAVASCWLVLVKFIVVDFSAVCERGCLERVLKINVS